MTDSDKAVFLSYASEDAGVAKRICDALRAAGIVVWFDQSELRGGDAWDQEIRRQITNCALFVPLISAATQARPEGYFRLEWKLAVDRSHLMAAEKAFLVPIVVDAMTESDALVPARFREVQWTRISAGEVPAELVERMAALLIKPVSRRSDGAERRVGPPHSRRLVFAALVLVISAVVVSATAIHSGWIWHRSSPFGIKAGAISSAPTTTPTAVSEHSVAVMPFVDLSEAHDQEYFSDGLSEELINLLVKVQDLRVPARTSSFYFKGKQTTIAQIASDLRVAYVVEGSVRKAGNRLRITAQLVRADTGYHLWSETYDRRLDDIFRVQDEIAKSVVGALKLKLVAGAQNPSSRGTTNIEAYNLYLLGSEQYRREGMESSRSAVDTFRKAIALDANYAAAYAALALAEVFVADFTGDMPGIDRAAHEADTAVSQAPADANVYAVRCYIRMGWLWDWSGAQNDIEKALALDARDSDVQHRHASLLVALSRLPEAIVAEQRATDLDPLSSTAWEFLGKLYMKNGDYALAEAALARAVDIEPRSTPGLNNLGTLRLLQGRAQQALEVFRKNSDEGFRLTGIAMAEHTLRHATESKQALEEAIATHAPDSAYQIAQVYAWRGEPGRAFEWLDRAYRQQDGGLYEMNTDPLFKSLRPDPRFHAQLRKMKLPE